MSSCERTRATIGRGGSRRARDRVLQAMERAARREAQDRGEGSGVAIAATIQALSIERIVVAHGKVIEDAAMEQLVEAWRRVGVE